MTVSPNPAAELLTADECKTHLRITTTDHDTEIGLLLIEARAIYERDTNRSLVTTTWNYFLDGWPRQRDRWTITPPIAPLQSVVTLKYIDPDGNLQTWDAANYQVDTNSEPGRIVPAADASFPDLGVEYVNNVQVNFEAGYGDTAADVPDEHRRPVLLLVGYLFDQMRDGATDREVVADLRTYKNFVNRVRIWNFGP